MTPTTAITVSFASRNQSWIDFSQCSLSDGALYPKTLQQLQMPVSCQGTLLVVFAGPGVLLASFVTVLAVGTFAALIGTVSCSHAYVEFSG